MSALKCAIDRLVSRHEALRMTFPATVNGRPEARVAEAVEVPLDVVAPPAGPAGQVYDILRSAAAEPFNLAAGPLLRSLLASLADDDHVLAAAITGRASFVAARDRHLLVLAEYEGIEILEPDPALHAIKRQLEGDL